MKRRTGLFSLAFGTTDFAHFGTLVVACGLCFWNGYSLLLLVLVFVGLVLVWMFFLVGFA